MLPFVPSLVLVLLLAAPALLTPTTSQELQVRGHRTPRDAQQDTIKVVISEGCNNQGDSSDVSQGGKEIDLSPGSPIVLTHKIKLVPSGSGSGSGSCGCETDFAALRERLERLEREVSALREKCGGAEGGCCTSKESKGAGCSIKPDIDECPNECSDQGRCVDGKCVCFPGYSGPDCSESNCPGNCNDNGRCVNGQCVCDPGFSGPNCSQRGCPDNCNDRGRCVNGRCVCDSGFAGPSCSDESCPGNCNNRGRCVNGKCVCKTGFSGPDCSKRGCPDNCSGRGRCVNGKCVCDSGFTGADCSETACPGNCNNRGRCVNGECVCNEGFGGPDCSEIICPNDCYDRGRCVNGVCMCDSGFTGADCSEVSCPGNCNNRGRCVNGQCVCDTGFTGEDCSEKACPKNCNNRGKCVNGKCVCDVGFAGPDCAAKGCPNNCNNKGQCVKGRCVCRRGFTGPDCSQCEDGMTGPNCDTAMLGVSQLSTRDITETSVTLVWTPPPVQYETYYITFSSQKESDQQISVQVEGSLTTFTQTGLAAGQEYTVTITGEIDGRRGTASSAEFMTLISGPTNLQVVKTTTTSAVVQWEQSLGEIDRYRLTVTPNDGAGRSQEITVPSDQNSAHIQQLEAGRLYDIILTAEKGSSRSKPATTQVTPVTMAALTMQGPVRPGQDVSNRDQEFDRQGRREDGSEADSDTPNKDSSATVIARNKPLVSRNTATNGTRPTFSKKPNVPGSFRFNTTRVVPGARRFGPGPLKKNPGKVPIVPKKTKPGVPMLRNKTLALTGRDPRVETSSTERADAKNPASMSGTDSVTSGQTSSEGQTLGTKEQPDVVGTASNENDTAPVSSGPTGTVQSQEKKCLNKIKVTHVRLPLKDRGSGCRGDGTVLGGKTSGSNQGSSETDDVDYSPDPLHKLVKDTFDKLNITTFSVHHLAQPSKFSVDAEKVRMQILGGFKPLSLSSSGVPPSSSESPSAAPSTSASFSSSDESDSVGSKEPDIDYSKSTTDVASPKNRKVPPSGKVGVPLFRRTSGYVRRPQPNIGWFQNKTHPHLRTPHPTPNLNLLPARETETRHTSTGELLSSTSSSASEESSVEVNVPARDTSGDIDGATKPASSGVEQNKKKVPTERGRTPLRRTPLKGGYLRNPNFGPLWNRTRPISRLLPPPSQPLISASETRKEQVSSSELLATLPPPGSKESYPAEGTEQIREANEDKVGTSMSTEVSQTLRGSAEPSSHEPNTKVGYIRRLYGGRYPNQNRTNLRPPQHPYRGPVRKPFPGRKLNGGSGTYVRSQTSQLEKSNTPEIPDNQSVEQGAPIPTQGVQINQSGEKVVSEVILTAETEGFDPTLREQTNKLVGGDNAPVQTLKSVEKETRTPDSYSDVQAERLNAGEDPGSTSPGRPSLKHVSSPRLVSERGASVPVQTIKIGEKQTRTPDSNSDSTLKQTSNSGQGISRPVLELGDNTPVQTTETGELESTGTTSQSTPTLKETSDSRQASEQGDNATVQSIKSGEEETRSPDSKSDIYEERVNAGENTGSTSQGTPTLKETSDSRPVSERGDNAPAQTTKTGEEETRTPDSSTDVHKEKINAGEMMGPTIRGRPTLKQTSDSRQGASKRVVKLGDKAPVQTIKSGEEETRTPDSKTDSEVHKKRITAGKTPGYTNRGRPTVKQTSDSRHGGPKTTRPVTPPKRKPPTRMNPMRHYISGSQKTNYTTKRPTDSETDQRRSPDPKPLTGSDVSSSGVTREPLDNVGVTNRTSDGFTLTWDSPEGKYKNFVVTKKEVTKGPKLKDDQEDRQVSLKPIKEAENGRAEDENRVPESTQVPTAKPQTGSDETFKKVLPGTARSFQFENLPRQTEYTVTLLGKGSSGLLSKLHKLVISTGPEPPTNIIFSKVTENSLTVSWTKPKSPISGFKVTYTHTEDGEPVSVSVDKDDSTLGLTRLSPGSTYEVSVISILGLDESDPIKDLAMTLPDPPTDLRVVNVTDSKALLLWRPALAAIDKYSIVYGSGTGSELRVSVSGNAAEQQLSGLEGSTTYTVTITSQLGSRESSPATTTFTTARGSGGDGDRPGDLQARDVTPRTALLSWKPPSNPVGSYRLTYQTEGQEMKEVIVDASVTEYNLTRLHPASKYTVQLQAETGGRYTSAIVTDFTTGTLRFPFPTDCSQELLNGIRTSGEVEIFPQGKPGTSIMVYCDMETDGGGWMVFQRRKDGSVDFFRGWKDYVRGFGDLSGEFWLGLDNLHNLTTMTRMTLRVDLRDKDESVFAKYSTFEVAKRNYRLSVGGYSGTAGDSLSYHNNRVFSTRDRDPAPFITRCAMSYRGGWWYKNCHEANLNGLYGIDVKHQGVIWTSWKGKDHSIPFTEMKMRPAAFSPPIRG